MENMTKYYGADASDKVLLWIFYRMMEAEHFNGVNEIKYVCVNYKQIINLAKCIDND